MIYKRCVCGSLPAEKQIHPGEESAGKVSDPPFPLLHFPLQLNSIHHVHLKTANYYLHLNSILHEKQKSWIMY